MCVAKTESRTEKIVLWMFILGLNLRFIAGYIAAFRLSADNRLFITEAGMGVSALFIIASGTLAAVHYGWSWIKPRYRFMTALFLCYLLVIVLRSGPDLPSGFAGFRRAFTWLGPLAFLYPVCIFLGRNNRLWKVLLPVLAVHCLIAIPVVLVTMDWVSLKGTISAEVSQYRPYRLLYGFPFLIICYRKMGGFGRIAGSAAFATFFFYGISANRRALIYQSVIILLLTVIVHWRTKNTQGPSKSNGRLPGRVVPVMVALVCILALLAFPAISERISIGTDVLNERWADYNRAGDIHGFVEDMDFASWIIGRGALGGYTPPEGYYRYIRLQGGGVVERLEDRVCVDIGWLHLVLKGGVILVVLVLLVPAASAIEVFFETRNQLTLTCACIVFLWLARLLYQGFFSTFPYMILLWPCVGRCLSVSGNSRPR